MPLLNLFSLHFLVFSGSYKGPIVPPVSLGDRAQYSVFCLLLLIFFQLSGQDLRGSADTYQRQEMAKIIIKQAVSSYLFDLTNACHATGMLLSFNIETEIYFCKYFKIRHVFAQIDDSFMVKSLTSGTLCLLTLGSCSLRVCFYQGSHSWEVKLGLNLRVSVCHEEKAQI